MKVKNFIVMLLLLVVIITIGSVSANGDIDFSNDSSVLEVDDKLNDVSLSASNYESFLTDSNTVEVDNYGENHNEMNQHTIKNAITSSKDGDTLIIRGSSYEHVHVTVDKQLIIKSHVATILEPCSQTSDSGYQGMFYLTSKASGTIIEGFVFRGIYAIDGYGILINGASNVIIRNCTFSFDNVGDAIRIENAQNTGITDVRISNAVNGIKIKNSQISSIKNSIIKDSSYAVDVLDSTKSTITSNNILNNKVAGIEIDGSSSYIIITSNNITGNSNYGIEVNACDNVDILSNYIASNSLYGVYINSNVVLIQIIGNFFYKNLAGEIYNGPDAFGFFKEGGEKYEVVNNNYMVGVGERPVNTVTGGVFLAYAFLIEENINCPIIHYKFEQEYWYNGNYLLQLSEITQSKKGVYSLSIVDTDKNVAKGLSSVPVTFYLNKNNNYVSPQEGDVYRTVMMVDGVATVRFYADEFKESENIVTVVLPGSGLYLTSDGEKNVKTFNVDDDSIPGEASQTKLFMNNLNTYSNSNVTYTVVLMDINNNPLSNEQVVFSINSKNILSTTNSKGQATIKINLNSGSYPVKVTFTGDGIDYSSSSAQARIIVNKISTKIIASNYAMVVKNTDYYKFTLKDSSNNILANQKITIKVNKKTYIVKTNSKGIAKLKLNLKKGTYEVVMNYKGSSKYNLAKKTTKISVKKALKTKLTVPKITTAPKTSTKYTVTLKDENGNAVKKQSIIIKLNGKKYTKKTNSKGQVTINLKLSKIKSYKVISTFKATNQYKRSSASGKITVGKIATKIIAQNININPNTQIDYKVTLKTISGKVIPNQYLKITLNGQTYVKTTDSNGQITVQVKFFKENSYTASVTYGGSTIYDNSKSSATIVVSRLSTQLMAYDRTFSNNSNEIYSMTLKDTSGNLLSGQNISYSLNNHSYSQLSDVNGQIKVNISSWDVGNYILNANFAQTNQYNACDARCTISIINKTGITFIDGGLPNDMIQSILDETTNSIEFLANVYNNVSLIFNKSLNIVFHENTTLNGRNKCPVLTVAESNFNISDLTINANECSGIVIAADNVIVENNYISNMLNKSKINGYKSGDLAIPGDGILIYDANNVKISKNNIKSFFNSIFLQNSENVEIDNNNLYLSNYGITYGLNVKNTQIINNSITKNIGLYVMDVPEGPCGYGIFLNQSAVNVSVLDNRIIDNYLGISIDSNYSTGIVIKRNVICDNALEGIRFNAGYDLADNAAEPDVNDNAIYRNARGPSMMILGELSANPDGIYHFGLYNDTKRLQLGANWFGKNARVTWDYDNNITGYGTMCPRINAKYISVGDIEVVSPGNYSITFYKYYEVASELPVFEMYATLNDDVEIKFNVVNGVGTFDFYQSSYNAESNVVKVSIGSLKDQYRTFEVLLSKSLNDSEIHG